MINSRYQWINNVVQNCVTYNQNRKQILSEKLELGSYAAITGSENLPLSLLEPLRGMLGDDPQQRWGPEEIDLWLSGRKMSPQQKRAGKRGQTPFAFMGRHYQSVRQLADAFTKHIPEGAKAIREAHKPTGRQLGDFTKWEDQDCYKVAFDRLLRDLKAAG